MGLQVKLETNGSLPSRLRDVIEKGLVDQIAMDVKAPPEKYRAALVLKDIEELPYEDVARVLNCPLGTVKSRINRARMLLKGKMEGLLGSRRALSVGLKAAGNVAKPNRA